MSLAGAGFPPVLLAMAKDRRLRPTDIQVFLVAAQHLDFYHFRPLKALVISHEMRTTVWQARKALGRLAVAGYLERSARVVDAERGLREFTYRLPYSMPSGGDKKSPLDAPEGSPREA